MPGRPRITRETIAGWLVRSSAHGAGELFTARQGGRPIDRWCVASNYRSALMRPGDPIVLWVSGDGRRFARGVWGWGNVTGSARPMPDAHDGRLSVPVHIELLDRPVTDAELRAAGIGDLEVQRQPMGSNPSWISVPQLQGLRQLAGVV